MHDIAATALASLHRGPIANQCFQPIRMNPAGREQGVKCLVAYPVRPGKACAGNQALKLGHAQSVNMRACSCGRLPTEEEGD